MSVTKSGSTHRGTEQIKCPVTKWEMCFVQHGPSRPITIFTKVRVNVQYTRQDMKSIQPNRCSNKFIILDGVAKNLIRWSQLLKHWMCSVSSFMPQKTANWCHPGANYTTAKQGDKSAKIIVFSLELKIEAILILAILMLVLHISHLKCRFRQLGEWVHVGVC